MVVAGSHLHGVWTPRRLVWKLGLPLALWFCRTILKIPVWPCEGPRCAVSPAELTDQSQRWQGRAGADQQTRTGGGLHSHTQMLSDVSRPSLLSEQVTSAEENG